MYVCVQIARVYVLAVCLCLVSLCAIVSGYVCVCVCVPDNATKQQTMGASISSSGKSSTSFIYCIDGNG